jgi:hypothetical protein
MTLLYNDVQSEKMPVSFPYCDSMYKSTLECLNKERRRVFSLRDTRHRQMEQDNGPHQDCYGKHNMDSLMTDFICFPDSLFAVCLSRCLKRARCISGQKGTRWWYSLRAAHVGIDNRNRIEKKFDTRGRNCVHVFLVGSRLEESERSYVGQPRRSCGWPSASSPPPWIRRCQPLTRIYLTVVHSVGFGCAGTGNL